MSERPPEGDPQRGLQNMLNLGSDGVNPFLEIPNRGKRSVTLDLSSEAGRELLLKLVEPADVFLTSYVPKVRQKLRIDVDDLKAVNPRLIYARGSGWGSKGPMDNTGIARADDREKREFDPLHPRTTSPLVAYLASEASSWLSGQVLHVEGNTVIWMNGWEQSGDRYTARSGGFHEAEELAAGMRLTYRAFPPGLVATLT